jgi:uncharacterized alkaline shock family protein YloU
VSTPTPHTPHPTPVGLPPGDADLSANAVDRGMVVVPVEVPVPVVVTENVESTSDAGADGWSGEVTDVVAHGADQVAALVLSVPGVSRLHAGVFGEAATYLPGRRVTGIQLGDGLVEVHVVVAHGTPIRDTAQQIHTVVAALVAAPVHVFVEDVDAA